jgi:serine/threonine protein kinase
MPGAISRLNAALAGRYAIERELGEGGMATVYLAEDLKHEHPKYAPISEHAVAPTRRSLL